MNLDLLECVSPYKIKNLDSSDSIVKIAKLLPIKNVDEDKLSVEWRLVQIDAEIIFPTPKSEYERIDVFWNKIFLLKKCIYAQ